MKIWTIVIFMFVMIATSFGVEYWRLHALTTGAYDAVENCAISAITDNQASLYNTEKDMYAGAYTYADGSWQSDINTQDISNTLLNHMNLRQSGSDYIMLDSNGHEEYRLANLSIQTTNVYTPSGDSNSSNGMQIVITFDLKTNFLFAGSGQSVSIPMKVPVGAQGKF